MKKTPFGVFTKEKTPFGDALPYSGLIFIKKKKKKTDPKKKLRHF